MFGSSSPFGSGFFEKTNKNPIGSTTPFEFGASSSPAFGNTSALESLSSSSVPAFGSSSTTAFGASGASVFVHKPSFGSSPAQTSTFGITSSPGFGAQETLSTFGTTKTLTFDGPSTSALTFDGPTYRSTSSPFGGSTIVPAFSASSSAGLNFSSTPCFGQSSSTFGCSQSGSQSSPFCALGNTGFGQSAFGSRAVPYTRTTELDSGYGSTHVGKLESISAMPVYIEKSHEELRWQDYQSGDKGGPIWIPAGGNTSNTTAATSTPFSSLETLNPSPFSDPDPFWRVNTFDKRKPAGFPQSPASPSPFGQISSCPSTTAVSLFSFPNNLNPTSSSVVQKPFEPIISPSRFGGQTNMMNNSPFGNYTYINMAFCSDELSRISLRQLLLSNMDDVMVWFTDEKVHRFTNSLKPNASKEDVKKLMEEWVTHPWFRVICIDNKPIGNITVTPNSGDYRCRAELGYVLGFKFWGKGIATRAVKLVTDTIFKEWPHLERLEAFVDVENVSSQRVLEKAGFQKEGVLRKHFLLKGRCRDMEIFSFLSTDCPM